MFWICLVLSRLDCCFDLPVRYRRFPPLGHVGQTILLFFRKYRYSSLLNLFHKRVSGEELKWLRVDITKIAHFLLFALLGGLLYVRQGRGSVWRVVADTGMLACGTELVQLFVDDRSALVGDVVIDMVGVGVGVLVAGAFGWRRVHFYA